MGQRRAATAWGQSSIIVTLRSGLRKQERCNLCKTSDKLIFFPETHLVACEKNCSGLTRKEKTRVFKASFEKSHTNIWDEQPSDFVSEELLWAWAWGSAPAGNILLNA